jgi:hypothetical protein
VTSVPVAWPGATVVCIGTGPSLTQADVDACRGKARVIAVNDAYRLAPWADVLYACDAKWWAWHKGAPEFAGLKYTLRRPVTPPLKLWPGCVGLQDLGRLGLSLDPAGLKTGHNSGYQALNLAVLFGAARVLLLGYDMHATGQKDHFFGKHPDQTRPPFRQCLDAFLSLLAPLKELGVEVVNCTPGSALKCFPAGTLAEELRRSEAAA